MLQQVKPRQGRLLELLVQEKDYRPTSYFSNKLSVSEKTIYNDIEQLNEVLLIHKLNIKKMPRKGLMLAGDDKAKEMYFSYLRESNSEHIDTYSPINRKIEIMRLLLIEQKKVSYEMLSNIFYVSTTSIRNDIEELQLNFNLLDAKIVSDNTGTSIIGDEMDIQKGLNRFIIQTFDRYSIGNKDWSHYYNNTLIAKFFEPKLINCVVEIISEIILSNNRLMSDYYLKSIYITLAIFISRAQQNNHIEKNKGFIFENIKNMELYMIALEITNKSNKQLGIIFNENDIEFLSAQLFAHGIKPKLNDKLKNDKYTHLTKNLIKKMSDMVKVDLTDDTRLYDSLLFHIAPMIYRLEAGIKIKNPLLQEIIKQYRVIFTLTWDVISSIEKEFGISLDDDEVSFITIHFQVALDKKVKPKNILIACPMGLSTSELIFNRVRQCIPATDNIETTTVDQIYNNDIKNVDFIISSTPIRNIDKPVIYVSPLVTNEEINKISQFYSHLNSKINTLREIINPELPSILQYLDKSLLFWNKTFLSKDECLNFLIEQYEEEGIVSSEFRKSIFQREKMGATSLYTGVAMPHACPSTVKKSKISIMTLDKKVNWGENNVQVVIMLAISEQDIGYVKEVLAKLYEIVESNEKVNMLLQIKENNELVNMLQDEVS